MYDQSHLRQGTLMRRNVSEQKACTKRWKERGIQLATDRGRSIQKLTNPHEETQAREGPEADGGVLSWFA